MPFDAVRDAYSSLVDVYLERFGRIEGVDREDLAFIRKHLGERPGRVIDLGCGPGHLTDYLRTLGRSVRGVDLVPEFIASARANYPEAQFAVGSMTDLAGPFDGALAWYSLIHLRPDEVDAVTAGLARLIVPGGVLVSGFFVGDEVGPFDHAVTTAYHWPVDEFARRWAAAGLVEVDRLPLHRNERGRLLGTLALRNDG